MLAEATIIQGSKDLENLHTRDWGRSLSPWPAVGRELSRLTTRANVVKWWLGFPQIELFESKYGGGHGAFYDVSFKFSPQFLPF